MDKGSEKKKARIYDKGVQPKSFTKGELVRKTILPLGQKEPKFGKRSSNQEGPFMVHCIQQDVIYQLKKIDRDICK